MTTGDVTDRVGHRQYSETEGEGDTEQANSNFRKGRSEDCTTTATKNQPKGSDEFS